VGADSVGNVAFKKIIKIYSLFHLVLFESERGAEDCVWEYLPKLESNCISDPF